MQSEDSNPPSDAPSRSLRIALAQITAGPDVENNLNAALAAMDRAAEAGAQLVAFPELAVQLFFPRCRRDPSAPDPRPELAETIPGPITERIGAKARDLGLVTVFNLYEKVEDDDGTRYYDSSPVFDRDGSLLGVSRMVHITDFPGFHEQDYYDPGDALHAAGARVFDTAVGRIGVCICYDRHFPEQTRALGLAGAELVLIPQAGVLGEWPEGMYEAEVRVAAFHNGYFAALCNRIGAEGELTFAGESFVSDPEGRVLARGKAEAEDLVIADLDLGAVPASTARRLFFQHRRPALYRGLATEER